MDRGAESAIGNIPICIFAMSITEHTTLLKRKALQFIFKISYHKKKCETFRFYTGGVF
jgi:hypothetical protein